MPKNIDRLIKGYQAFRKRTAGPRAGRAFNSLVQFGQKPKVMIVACSDSRVDPALVLNCSPGDLFVVRNVANLVPPFERDKKYHGTSAALEFAICVLGVRHVIVFGHTQCGGIRSLFEKPTQPLPEPSFVEHWMDLARPARRAIERSHPRAPLNKKVALCEQQALLRSLKNLSTFPWIRSRVRANQLFLHAWQFDLSRRLIEAYNPAARRFKELKPVS